MGRTIEETIRQNEINWSLVIPIKDEWKMALRTLPHYYDLQPDQIILCLDDPPNLRVVRAIEKVGAKYHGIMTTIVPVERDPAWGYHQAHVRRVGFGQSRYDIIMTGDIDLLVNKNCLLAPKLLSENHEDGIGLVSVSKFYYPRSLRALWRLFFRHAMRLYGMYFRGRRYLGLADFTGLYCFYRPYWRATEDQEKIKNLYSPKDVHLINPEARQNERAFWYCGEDTFLRDCMEKKYNVLYLKEIGGISLRSPIRDKETVQFFTGIYYWHCGTPFRTVLLNGLFSLRPYFTMGWLWRHHLEKKRRLAKHGIT